MQRGEIAVTLFRLPERVEDFGVVDDAGIIDAVVGSPAVMVNVTQLKPSVFAYKACSVLLEQRRKLQSNPLVFAPLAVDLAVPCPKMKDQTFRVVLNKKNRSVFLDASDVQPRGVTDKVAAQFILCVCDFARAVGCDYVALPSEAARCIAHMQ